MEAAVWLPQGPKNDVETAQKGIGGVIRRSPRRWRPFFRQGSLLIQAPPRLGLFGGGQGTLSLEDETDVLPLRHIEIRAQPRARPCGPSFSLEEAVPWWPSPCTLPFEDSPCLCVVDGLSGSGRANGAVYPLPAGGGLRDPVSARTHRRRPWRPPMSLWCHHGAAGVSRVLKLDLHQAEALLDTPA